MKERLIQPSAIALTLGALAIGGAKEANAQPPFGDLPVPPAGGGKPDFVENQICDFVEELAPKANCQ